MEGNFYVSPDRLGKKLRSQLGQSYLQCRTEADSYGKCIEGLHVNKSVKKDGCKPERVALDGCVERDWQYRMKKEKAKK